MECLPQPRGPSHGPSGTRPSHGRRFAALLLAVCTWLGCGAVEVPRCAGCNLLLISVDTLRGDHLGCLGHLRDTAPAVCAFFETGLVFENAISQSPWTGPAHASMFTSRYPHEHGLNVGPRAPRVGDHPDLFAILRESGYFTAAVHGGGYVTQALREDSLDAIVTGKSITFRRDPVRLFERALEAKPAGQPFALFLHGYDPHLDYKPKRNWFAEPQPDLDEIAYGSRFCKYEDLEDGSKRIDPATVPSELRARSYFELLYDAEIRDVDESLGRLFEHLESSGLAAQTVVVFTSDHGEEFFEHGSCEHVKTVHQELLHVPLMIRVPGGRPARRADLVPSSLGIAPTALDALGLEPDRDSFRGKSLLEGPRSGEPFFAETTFHYDRRLIRRFAVFSGQRKLILEEPEGILRSFDLAADPQEQRDLASAGDLDESLADQLRAFARRSAAATRTEGVELDCESLRSLRSLGYLHASDDPGRCP